ALAAGCAGREVVDPATSPNVKKLAEAKRVELRLVVAPIVDARPVPATLTADAEPSGTVPVPQFDPAAFQRELATALESANAVKHVSVSDARAGEGLLRKAYADGDDVILEVTVRRYEL